jgi:hypothetical protein
VDTEQTRVFITPDCNLTARKLNTRSFFASNKSNFTSLQVFASNNSKFTSLSGFNFRRHAAST